jgi:hypothetical protein
MSSLNINKSTKDDIDTRTAFAMIGPVAKDLLKINQRLYCHGYWYTKPWMCSCAHLPGVHCVDCRWGKPSDYTTRLHSLNQYSLRSTIVIIIRFKTHPQMNVVLALGVSTTSTQPVHPSPQPHAKKWRCMWNVASGYSICKSVGVWMLSILVCQHVFSTRRGVTVFYLLPWVLTSIL